jgi:hypothetical protein
MAKPAKIEFRDKVLDGWKCSCGQEYLNPVQAQKLLAKNKKRGV